jgi:hypothetical protein
MMWTTELTEEEERLLALIPDCPRRKRPLPLPKPRLVSDHKLSVEGQRQRVVREVRELATAERNAPYREPKEAAFYYRQLHDAVAYAEQYACGQYDLFEKDRA